MLKGTVSPLHNHYEEVCVGFSCFKVILLEEEAFITELFNKVSSPQPQEGLCKL